MTIDKPGFYKTRGGERIEIVAVARGKAFGFDEDDDPDHWNAESGVYVSRESESFLDIVGPWTDPPEPWTPTGRLRFKKCDPNYTASVYMAMRNMYVRPEVQERNESGQTRWVPVPVE